MGYLYILQSEINGRYYIGSTDNVERRLIEHNSGKTRSLKYLRPLKIVFKQEFADGTQAHRAELKLKSYKSRQVLESIIKDGIIKFTTGH
jgi:putative endonuclease